MAGFQIKYRPETLDDIVGNTSAVNSIDALLNKKRSKMPQAILLHGERGCGKTTLGRILATELDCQKGSFFEYNSSNTRGIDTMREIQEQSQLTSLFGSVKVYLLDEFHMATLPAQNAALKMLEDCPKNTYFILATTNPEKLIKPIRSRCTSIGVSKLNQKQAERLLKRILHEEGDDEFPDEVLDAIVDTANGVPRDALKLLDQVIDMEDIDEMLEMVKYDIPDELGVKSLCLLLMEKPAHKKWKDVSNGIKNLGGDIESQRRGVLGFFSKVLLNSGEQRIAALAECFESNYFDSGNAGFILSCYDAMTI